MGKKTPLDLLSHEPFEPEFQLAGQNMPTCMKGLTVLGVTTCSLIDFEVYTVGEQDRQHMSGTVSPGNNPNLGRS